jgi:sensor histidine kinase YesM
VWDFFVRKSFFTNQPNRNAKGEHVYFRTIRDTFLTEFRSLQEDKEECEKGEEEKRRRNNKWLHAM